LDDSRIPVAFQRLGPRNAPEEKKGLQTDKETHSVRVRPGGEGGGAKRDLYSLVQDASNHKGHDKEGKAPHTFTTDRKKRGGFAGSPEMTEGGRKKKKKRANTTTPRDWNDARKEDLRGTFRGTAGGKVVRAAANEREGPKKNQKSRERQLDWPIGNQCPGNGKRGREGTEAA